MKIIYSKNKLPANNELHVRIFSLMYQCLYSVSVDFMKIMQQKHTEYTRFSLPKQTIICKNNNRIRHSMLFNFYIKQRVCMIIVCPATIVTHNITT